MIYSALIRTPNSQHPGITVYFAAKDTAAATAITQRLGVVLNSAAPTLIAGPRMCCRNTARMLGARSAVRGADNFDPMLLPDPDYREGYRKARIAAVGEGGLTPREQHETLMY